MLKKINNLLLLVSGFSFGELFTSPAIHATLKVFIASLISSALVFIGSIFTINALSIESFGVLSSYNNITALMSGLILSGLNLAFIRYFTLYLKKDIGLAKLLFKKIISLEIVFSFLILVITLFFSRFIADQFFQKPDLYFYIRLAGLGTFLAVLLTFFQSVFQSQEKYNFFSFVIIGQSLITTVIIFLLFVFKSLSTPHIIYANLSAYLLVIIASLLYYSKTPVARVKYSQAPVHFFREVMHYSKWLIIITLSSLLFSRLDVLMLTKISDLTQVGIFSFANTIYLNLLILVAAVNTIVLPKISRLESAEEINTTTNKIFRLSLILALTTIPFLFLVKPAVLLLFGTKYIEAMPVLYIMLVGFVISVTFNPVVNMLLILKKQRFMAYTNIAVLVYNFLLNLLLIPRYGARGAVIATITGMAWSNIIMAGMTFYLIKKNKKISSDNISKI